MTMITRRSALAASGIALAAAPAVVRAASLGSGARAVVVGGGVFGAWTARRLCDAGHHVTIVDAWEPGHSHSSSGGESRMCRAAYGAKQIYTSFAWDSLAEYKALSAKSDLPLFHPSGVLFMVPEMIPDIAESIKTHAALKLPIELLEKAEMARRFPMIDFDGLELGLYEREFGPVLARRSVEILVRQLAADGVELRQMKVAPLSGTPESLTRLEALGGETVEGDLFVFACGAWMGQILPDILKDRIYPTRQEMFFFAAPAGDGSFGPGRFPSWRERGSGKAAFYGFPTVEGRGFKIGSGLHGGPIDLDQTDRLPIPEQIELVRRYMAQRFPRLAGAALNSAEVGHYENTVGSDLLIDFHPAWRNAVLVGGGSGHGFKLGPAVGRYAAELLTGKRASTEAIFALAGKKTRDETVN